MSNKRTRVGDLKVRGFIHPDSLNQKVWEVEQLKEFTGKYAAEGEAYWGGIALCTSEEEALAYMHPVAFSLWEHTVGTTYRVVSLTNMTATDERYPKTIVQENTETGELWSRPLSKWHASMTLIED